MDSLVKAQQRVYKQSSIFSGIDIVTPKNEAEKIVDNIPLNILKNPNSRFLDVAAGIGTFPTTLFERLLEYHKRDHILDNMLYLVEISIFKCAILKKLGFRNVHCGDFLKYNSKYDMKFDVAITNLPFNNEGGMKSKGLNGAQQGKTNLYKDFISHLVGMTKPNGIVAVIAPPGAYKSFLNNGFNILRYYFNRVDVWGKSIATVSWFCSLDPTTKLEKTPPTIQDKLLTNNHDKITKRASKKNHSYFLYNYIKPLKVYSASEKSKLSEKEKGKVLPPVTLTESKINKDNLTFLLSYFLDYFNNHAAQWHSFNKRLKYEWLEDIDYLITEDDIIKQYKLTSEEVNIIKSTN